MRCGNDFPSLFCRMAHRGISSRAPGFCFRKSVLRAQLRVARGNRAEVRTGEIVTDVIADSSQVIVQTNRSRYARRRRGVVAGTLDGRMGAQDLWS